MATKAEQQAFLAKIIPMAKADMAKTKILASLTVAQAIIESNWGLSGLTKVSNNLFGMKGSYNGQSVQYKTSEEYTVGTSTQIVDGFKVYPSWQESVDDHSALFHRLARYHNLIGETDYKEACRKVKEDGFATSSTYTQTLINTIENYQLYLYDSPVAGNPDLAMLFHDDNRIEYQYGVYGQASGRTHRGVDVDTTSADIRVLSTVAGRVVSSTIITDKSNLTWEWGNYVCVLDASGYRHYFCHLKSRSVAVGETVTVGQEIGIMGMTGNAALDKQKEHVHYEVRKAPYGSANAIDPTPFCHIPNTVCTTWNHKQEESKEWDKMIFRSFGEKNMQGFAFPDAGGNVAYDRMPNGYRLVTERGIKGTDGQGWEWVKVLDERNGNALYTPLLADRNELLDDAPALVPSIQSGVSGAEMIASYAAQINSYADQIKEDAALIKAQAGVE